MGIAAALLVLGLILGGIIGYFMRQPDKESKQREEELENKITAKDQEFTEYKQEVANHFMQTANLVSEMTESYRAVHQHLAEGATQLCSDFVGVEQLEIKETKLLNKEAKAAAEEASTIETTEQATQEAPEQESVIAKEDAMAESATEEASAETEVAEETAKETAVAAEKTPEEAARTIH